MLLDYDGKARNADKEFDVALQTRKLLIENICGKPYAFTDKNVSAEDMVKDLPKYNYKIDPETIKIVQEIEADYKLRQGNLVINLAKFIKPEFYERSKNKRYKVNDNKLKRRLNISHKKTSRMFKKFLSTFGRESDLLGRECRNRLREIEEEMKRERANEDYLNEREDYYKN